LNWATIGSVLASVVALAAFFRPDVEAALKGEKPTVELTKYIVLDHRVGILWMLPFISVSNQGGTRVNIREISMYFIDRDNKVTRLDGDSYLRRMPIDDKYYPWTTLSLAPGEKWIERVNFREPLEVQQEDTFRTLMSDLGKAWGKQFYDSRIPRSSSAPNAEPNILNLKKRVQAFFSQNFKLHHGGYKLLVVLRNEENKIVEKRAYDLVIPEATIKALTEKIDGYFDSPPSEYDDSIFTEVPITPILDKESLEVLTGAVRQRNLL
jgi:hypothetical protein